MKCRYLGDNCINEIYLENDNCELCHRIDIEEVKK